MDVEAAVKSWIAGDAACIALVGTDVFDEVSPQGHRPEPGKGYVTVQVISDVPEKSLSGPTDLNTALVQVTGWAMDARTRRRIGNAMRSVFESRANGGGPVRRVSIEDSGHGYEFEGSGSAEAYRSARLDIGIIYSREPAAVGG